jgi:hypothetical protein
MKLVLDLAVVSLLYYAGYTTQNTFVAMFCALMVMDKISKFEGPK